MADFPEKSPRLVVGEAVGFAAAIFDGSLACIQRMGIGRGGKVNDLECVLW